MKPAWLIARLFQIAVFVCAAASARGEEIILRNGQKIVGTIVGYEKDMFRVETDFGIALVRKDKVASIQVAQPDDTAAKTISSKPPAANPAAEKPAPAATPAAPAPSAKTSTSLSDKASASQTATKQASEKPAAASPAAPPGPTAYSMGSEKAAPPTPARTNPAAERPAPPSLAPETAPPPVAAPAIVAKPSPPPSPPVVSHPLDTPLPTHLQEHVDGSTYINDTFQFSMFKPPDWKIYEGVPKETGSGIMAMGADDEQTLMFVDRQVWSGAPNLNSNEVEARLRQPYQEFRKISEESFQCDGLPAIRRTFTGILDGAEWHGVAVHVAHGNEVFGIVGLTSAETFGFQQAIFSKIIKTFHFLTTTPPKAILDMRVPASGF